MWKQFREEQKSHAVFLMSYYWGPPPPLLSYNGERGSQEGPNKTTTKNSWDSSNIFYLLWKDLLDCRGNYFVVFVYRPHLCALHLLPIRHTSLRRSSVLVDLQIGNNLKFLLFEQFLCQFVWSGNTVMMLSMGSILIIIFILLIFRSGTSTMMM